MAVGTWRVVAFTLLLVAAGTWTSLIVGLTFWANAPMIGGWRPRVVLTGSMQPGIKPGDVVLVQRVRDTSSLPPGRVVLVRDDARAGGTYVHRVVRAEGNNLVTKGDANQSEDFPSVTPSRVMGQARLVVPAIGLPLIWMRQGDPVRAAGSALLTWAALIVVVQGFRQLSFGRRDDLPGADPA